MRMRVVDRKCLWIKKSQSLKATWNNVIYCKIDLEMSQKGPNNNLITKYKINVFLWQVMAQNWFG